MELKYMVVDVEMYKLQRKYKGRTDSNSPNEGVRGRCGVGGAAIMTTPTWRRVASSILNWLLVSQ